MSIESGSPEINGPLTVSITKGILAQNDKNKFKPWPAGDNTLALADLVCFLGQQL